MLVCLAIFEAMETFSNKTLAPNDEERVQPQV